MDRLAKVLQSLSGYGEMIGNVLLLLLGGMVLVIVLYRLVHAIIKPEGKYSRLVKVVFGAVYAIILVLTVLLAAEQIGFDVDQLAGPAILLVMVISVLVFFIIPFLPRLPFKIGETVEVKGIMGTVTQITTYHTLIRTFDGQQVFMPNALLMASAITNYSELATRRVALGVEIYAGDDIARARELLLQVMSAHELVLDDPAPAVFVTAANGRRSA